MALQTTWFIFIALLWAGFFLLEGFDFGVGMLVPLLGRDDAERRALRATIAPVWDGNEVWLITAGGATFAAFPDWYATMFSAYYLPLFLVLVALIVRACASEYRAKASTERGRDIWDWLMASGCLLAPLLIGVALGGLLGGIPIDAQLEFTGTLPDLVAPYALLSGLALTAMCVAQALAFLRLKTTGEMQARVTAVHRVAAFVAAGFLVVFVGWTQAEAGGLLIPNAAQWLAITFAVAAAFLATYPHQGWGFACTSGAIAFAVIGLFGTLHPNLMVSSTSAANNITLSDSSGSYTLTLMTVIAAVMLPVVVLYQAWTYRVFRQRVAVVRSPGGGTTVTTAAGERPGGATDRQQP